MSVGFPGILPDGLSGVGKGGERIGDGTRPFLKCKYMDQRSSLKQIEDNTKLSWVQKCALDYLKMTY